MRYENDEGIQEYIKKDRANWPAKPALEEG
jgi:hypothetical protein